MYCLHVHRHYLQYQLHPQLLLSSWNVSMHPSRQNHSQLRQARPQRFANRADPALCCGRELQHVQLGQHNDPNRLPISSLRPDIYVLEQRLLQTQASVSRKM